MIAIALANHTPLHLVDTKPCAAPDDCSNGDEGHDTGNGQADNSDGGNENGVDPTSSITGCPDVSTTTITITTRGTDYTTVTADASAITTTVTTEGAKTVTEPGATTTETLTITDIETTTDTTTLTYHQIAAEAATETETQTVTLHQTTTATSTVTSIFTTTVATEISSPTVTPDPSRTPNSTSNPRVYGTCTDPTINYVLNTNGLYIYTTNNQANFQFGESPTIQSPAALICNRLESPCNAPAETVTLCHATTYAVAGLEGQAAADAWNKVLLSIAG
ncbi:hypothetical protein BJX63DRAFT_430225 [Aspergillus granulosus]|uniref:Uncharacterized protein n=1 Tax=Aspergillus granulosus TaxID=176169 RepID=A0ABR4HM21_9EURO